LSPLGRDPSLSVVAVDALKLPAVRPDAEAVLALRPDLVLAGRYGAQAVVALVRDRGVRVVQVDEKQDFAGVADEVASVADVLGVKARGAAMVASMWARLAAVVPAHRGRAIFWQARGFTAGPGSFADVVLRKAGFVDVGTGGQMSVEALATHPPDVLITEAAPAYPSLATDMVLHPALAFIARRSVDPALLACPGPWSVGAVEALAW
jgi:iron complex transport system substrate-binding protein